MRDPLAFPRLHPDARVAPFSSGARERTFLLTCPDGRALEVSASLSELIRLLDGEHSRAQIAQSLSRTWGAAVGEEEIRLWLERHLLPRGVLLPGGPATPRAGAAKQGLRGVTLLPARALLPLSGRLRLLFRPRVALPVLCASAACRVLLYTQLHCAAGPPLNPSPADWAVGTVLLIVSVLFHELGHLAACRWFGAAHGEIRFGLYLIFPVLYANVTSAWQLPRKARVVVDLGGVYFQALLTLPLFLLHTCFPAPLWLFLLVQLDAMVLLALNPFLRFDGYWVCSDLLGVPNLRTRSRRVCRLLLGRILGRDRPAPHPFLRLRRPEAVGLLAYTAGSYLFYFGILLLLARYFPARLAAVPAQVRHLAGLMTGPESAAPAAALPPLLSLLFTLVLATALLRAAWTSLTAIRHAVRRRAPVASLRGRRSRTKVF